MDFSKGLYRLSDPVNQPAGTYPFGKNGVLMEKMGSLVNEKGLTAGATLDGQVCGVIPTDDTPIVFVVRNRKLLVYKLRPDVLDFRLVKDTATLPGAPDFDPKDYITGEAERNYKGELVVAFTNKKLRPLYLNCDRPETYTDFKDLYLIPVMKPPRVTLRTESGTGNGPGAYFPFVAYEREDGTATHYIFGGTTAVIGEDDPAALLRIDITEADTRYDYLVVGLLKRSGGKSEAVQLERIPLTGPAVSTVYSGTETTTVTLPEKLLVIPPDYTAVGCMGQLNGELYIGNLKSEEEIDFQSYALLVKVKWKSELISALTPPDDHRSGTRRGLMHQEVYALYIRLWTVAGRPSRWFHLPGPVPLAADLQEVQAGNMGAQPRYKVQDTVRNLSPGERKGDTGVWVNESETYPDHAAFDATALGGPDLRGKPVRHHRMPSVAFLKEQLYAASGEYGRTQLDLLGLEVSNVVLPAHLKDVVAYYEIGFARRTTASSTVAGTGLLLYGGFKEEASDGTLSTAVYSAGGNWRAAATVVNNTVVGGTRLAPRFFRLHPFDMLYYKPAVKAWALAVQLKYKTTEIRMVEDGRYNRNNIAVDLIVDYTAGTTVTSGGNLPHKVKDSYYLVNNGASGRFNNALLEGCFAGELEADGPPAQEYIFPFPEQAAPPVAEDAYLVSILMNRSNLFESFLKQQVVPMGGFTAPGQSAVVFSGDTFAGAVTIHTYGRRPGDWDNALAGLRVARRHLTLSAANVHLRFEDPANPYSRWWPKRSLTPESLDNYLTSWDQTMDPNQFGYNRDFNSLFDLDAGLVYSPYNENLSVFPYRVHRMGKSEASNKRRSWRNILPLDYYEMPRNLGEVVNLDGDDNLLIHMRYGLYITRDKAKLAQGPLSITLGTGDIFQFEPKEGLSAPQGYAGTQHDLACVRCPMGYLFVDAASGELFLHKGELKNLGEGLAHFLREALRIREVNTFTGNGLTIGYDPYYKRILLTLKKSFTEVPAGLVEGYAETEAFYAGLQKDVSVVYRNGRYYRFRGLNNKAVSGLDCPPLPTPLGRNGSTHLDENRPDGTLVAELAALFTGEGLVYSLRTGNTGGAFALDAATGKLTVANSAALDFETTPTFSLVVRAQNACGLYKDISYTVDLNDINENVEAPQDPPPNTLVLMVQLNIKATEPDNDPRGEPGLYDYGMETFLQTVDGFPSPVSLTENLRFTAASGYYIGWPEERKLVKTQMALPRAATYYLNTIGWYEENPAGGAIRLDLALNLYSVLASDGKTYTIEIRYDYHYA